jgi:hypothetical protein
MIFLLKMCSLLSSLLFFSEPPGRKQISAGFRHTGSGPLWVPFGSPLGRVLTEIGEVYVYGLGESGQLGIIRTILPQLR